MIINTKLTLAQLTLVRNISISIPLTTIVTTPYLLPLNYQQPHHCLTLSYTYACSTQDQRLVHLLSM